MRGGTISILCTLAAACGGGSGGSAPTSAPFGLEQREIVSGLAFPDEPLASGSVTVVDAFPALDFDMPVFVTHAPDGTDRLFVVELGGSIRVFANDPAVTQTTVFLDVATSLHVTGEGGLLGLAFDPDHAANGFLYVNYTAPTTTPGMSHRTVVSRFRVSADPDVVDAASETELLSFDQPFWNHNAGMLAFGPDGMLYVASGDGGSHDDPGGRGQDRTTLLGKILRIAPDGSIPPDNPFVGEGGGVREEIWAYGLRNPWRFSFDRGTGELWCGDVGQNAREEIDRIVRGGNYGWDVFEGTLDHENPGGLALASTEAPVHEYGRSLGTSVTGGYVYRGTRIPALQGAYVFGDYNSGRIEALFDDGVAPVSTLRIATGSEITSFGEDEAGELYFTSFDGRVYRLEPASGPPPAFPRRLSETGLFADTEALLPAPGVIAYDVNVPLWSDGVLKRRWIALPGSERIVFDATGAWGFPTGTVLVKHFEADLPSGARRRLETRVLVRTRAAWSGYTYRWNPDGTDADLLDERETETLTVAAPGPPGGSLSLTWTYPDRTDCNACHTRAAGGVLGVRARQLNRDFAYAETTDNQLRAWNHIDLFTSDIGSHTAYEALAPLADAAAPVGARARAYLAANCASCHRAGGPTPVGLDLRFGLPDSALNAIGVTPEAGGLGLTQPAILVPGTKESSVLWERMRRLDATRMPPLGSAVAHEEAIELVGRWIDGLDD